MPDEPLIGEPAPAEKPARLAVPWRLFGLLALAVLLASLLVLPYALQMMQSGKPVLANQADALRKTAAVNAVLQAILLYWPLTLLGLITAGRLGLGLPLLSAWLEGRRSSGNWKRILRPAAGVGFGMGFAILLISVVLSPLTANELLRLFLLSGLAWSFQWLRTRRRSGRPGLWTLWAANLVAALVFGLLHLPNLSALNVPVSPYLLAFIVSLNGAAGLAFGWLFWTYGLESAILAHFFMDLVLHVLTAALQGLAH